MHEEVRGGGYTEKEVLHESINPEEPKAGLKKKTGRTEWQEYRKKWRSATREGGEGN